MARFYGKVGFGEVSEIRPGIFEETIIERYYAGSVTRDAAKWSDSERIHKDLSVANTISIFADDYALNNVFTIRYVFWAGAYWTVTDVEVMRPRLNLRLGKRYNGPTG